MPILKNKYLSRIEQSFFKVVLPPFARFIIRLIFGTSRVIVRTGDVEDNLNHQTLPEKYIKDKKPFLACFWHCRLLYIAYRYRHKNCSAVISRNIDGEYISRAVEGFGINTIRGSSSKGGSEALLEVVRAIEQGAFVAFTPDGPRGPARKMKLGIILAAKLTGVPIIPLSYSAKYKISFNSWDKFILPLPFNKIIFTLGKEISVPKDCDDDRLVEKRIELEDELNAITDLADKLATE